MEHIENIIRNSETKNQFYYADFKNALTEENRIRFDALKVKGLDANFFTDYGEWKILVWDSFMDYDDESRYSGECEIEDKDNDGLNCAMEKIMDEFEKHIGEEWAGTEEEIIERIADKEVVDYIQRHTYQDEYEIRIYRTEVKEELRGALTVIRGLSKDENVPLFWDIYCLLDDETKKRYEDFKTIVVGRRRISVENCIYIPVKDFLNANVEKIETYDGWKSELTTYLTMNSDVNPNPDISGEIKDPNSLRSIAIAFNKMVNKAMDFYDEMRDMYRSYCENKSKN